MVKRKTDTSAAPSLKKQRLAEENESPNCRRVVPPTGAMSRSPVTPVKRPIQEQVQDYYDSTPVASGSKSATPSPSKAISNVYSHARALLRLSSDAADGQKGELLGRESEREALDAFLHQRLPELDGEECNGKGKAVLYVSGLPGTGKTALLQGTVNRIAGRAAARDVKVVMLNCLALKDPQDVWSFVPGMAKGKDAVLDTKMSKTLLILDEADRLATGGRNVLRHIFASANSAASRLTVIAIANSLDITQLTEEGDELPELLHFAPYTDKNMIAIAKQRLSHLLPNYDGISTSQVSPKEDLPLFQPVAMQLVARKVQAHSGDLRAFLGLLRTVVGLVETEQLDALPPTPANTPTSRNRTVESNRLAHLTPSSAPKASVKQAMAACKAARGGMSVGIDTLSTALHNITLGARLVLIGLAIAARDTSSAVVELSKGYAAYLAAIRRAGGRTFVDPLNETEWRLTVENLDVAGLLRSCSTPSPSSKVRKPKSSNGKATVELAYPFDKILTTATTAGKAGECALAVSMVNKNRVKTQYTWVGDEEAPSAGFNGNGLAGKITMGHKRSHEDDGDDV